MKRLRLPVFVAALIVAWVAVAPAGAESRTIAVQDNYFATKYLVVTVGSTITWTNDGQNSHTVTAFNGSYDSSPNVTLNTCDDANPLTHEDCLAPGDSFAHTYDQPGTYKYYCKIHGSTAADPDPQASAQSQPCGMCAEIVVRAGPTTKPTPTPTKSSGSFTRPHRSPSPSPSASKKASPSATGSVIAAPSKVGGKSGGGRAALALVAILVLGGAGFGVWKRYMTS